MPKYRIIDLFPEFMESWTTVTDKPVEAQIGHWVSTYNRRWPELLKKQLDNYAEENWREIARSRIFPYGPRLAAMQTAHYGLVLQCPVIYNLAVNRLNLERDLLFVIYAGIGCGAGWATTYQDQPAVLFGLENIAEEGWQNLPTLTGLIAHELGHIAHASWRNQKELPESDDPWWQLYVEGLAQRCEQIILERESWHMAGAPGWRDWCRGHRQWLAVEFIRSAETGNVRPFFGSWFDILGKKQTGYYLGQEVIRLIEKEENMQLPEIALLDATLVREKTQKIAAGVS